MGQVKGKILRQPGGFADVPDRHFVGLETAGNELQSLFQELGVVDGSVEELHQKVGTVAEVLLEADLKGHDPQGLKNILYLKKRIQMLEGQVGAAKVELETKPPSKTSEYSKTWVLPLRAKLVQNKRKLESDLKRLLTVLKVEPTSEEVAAFVAIPFDEFEQMRILRKSFHETQHRLELDIARLAIIRQGMLSMSKTIALQRFDAMRNSENLQTLAVEIGLSHQDLKTVVDVSQYVYLGGEDSREIERHISKINRDVMFQSAEYKLKVIRVEDYLQNEFDAIVPDDDPNRSISFVSHKWKGDDPMVASIQAVLRTKADPASFIWVDHVCCSQENIAADVLLAVGKFLNHKAIVVHSADYETSIWCQLEASCINCMESGVANEGNVGVMKFPFRFQDWFLILLIMMSYDPGIKYERLKSLMRISLLQRLRAMLDLLLNDYRMFRFLKGEAVSSD